MTAIVPRLLRIRPVCRWISYSFPHHSKSAPLSPHISNSKSEAIKSVFAHLNDFGAYLKGDQKTGNQLNPVSSKGSPPLGFTEKLGDLMERIKQHFTTETEKGEKTLQKHDVPGAIDGHTLNDPNEKLDPCKANVEVRCKCCTLFALSEAWIPLQTMNMDEIAISIIKAMDEQPDLTMEERFILAGKLMSSPAQYAMFKVFKGEERSIFLQSLLKW